MKPSIINVAVEQLAVQREGWQVLKEQDFFEEYIRCIQPYRGFFEEVENCCQRLTLEEVDGFTAQLEEKIEELMERMEGDFLAQPGVILLIGDGSYDGYGLLLQGEPYVFFDLAAILLRDISYHLDAFILHELIHPLHFYYNPSFYLDREASVEERFLKKMVIEGVATYGSSSYYSGAMADLYWLGLLTPNEVKDWIKRCQEQREEVARELKETLNQDIFNSSLYYRLFSVPDFERLNQYRLGYYYGTQVVEECGRDSSLQEVLKMSYPTFRQEILSYFHLDELI